MTRSINNRTATAARTGTRSVSLLALLGGWANSTRSRRVPARMTAEQLRDIGVTATEAQQMADLPFWIGRH